MTFFCTNREKICRILTLTMAPVTVYFNHSSKHVLFSTLKVFLCAQINMICDYLLYPTRPSFQIRFLAHK